MAGRARAGIAAVLIAASGCSNCTGVLDCVDTTPQRSLTGRVIAAANGAPVTHVGVTLVATYASGQDSSAVFTDDQGMFLVALAANRNDPLADLALRVSPPGLPGYTMHGIVCQPRRVRGDGCVLDPLLPAPRIPYLFQFVFRRSGGETVPGGVAAQFTQTGGPQLVGSGARTVYQGQIDGPGLVQLIPPSLYATSADSLVGDFEIDLPSPYGFYFRRNARIGPAVRFADGGVVTMETGPNIAYTIAFVDSATDAPVPGVEVAFAPKSGIVTSATYFRPSDSSGVALLLIRPLATGTVSGDLRIKAPRASAATILAGVAMSTFDADDPRPLARYRIGATGIPYP